jgi:outer membrane protein OmpA-like peptidoglycan-associated protein
MADSVLSFANSSTFRNVLLGRNLPPYTVTGVYTPQTNPVNYETNLTISNVIDSPNDLISESPFGQQLYPLNEYGPDGGYNLQITYNNPPLPVNSNKGEYDPNDTVLDLVNEFFIDAAYVENRYGPPGGYDSVVTITDIQNNNKIYQPYWDPPTFVPSFYTPYEIVLSSDPAGSDGLLSQDSYIAKIGAESLRKSFEARVNAEIYQNTVGLVNLESLSDPFEASLIVTGREPLIYKDYRITVPENPIVRAGDFLTRLASAYWPVSTIPGDYFNENRPNSQSPQTSLALNTINQLTGGFLGPILNLTRTPSEIFLANTGNGQRSFLFANINYNRYQPPYDKNFGGLLGVVSGIVNLVVNLINPDNGTLVGGYYVGSKNSDPAYITTPPNQIPVDAFGRQNPSPVYGPSELGQLYEGNIGSLKFGLAGKSLNDGGGIDGQFIWVSPKYKKNAGFKATPGGGTGNIDDDFNQINSSYQSNESTNLTFKETSILDQTQRLIDSADNVQGISRLKHVGNAINQVSKVFNDGYKELTKGSQVVSYKENATGTEVGQEYCRVFAKDTPYYTYNDLQKGDGITKSGRRFSNSVLDNTYNLNITPLRNPGSTNIIPDDERSGIGGYAKKYMFSIENLAWRTSSRPGFTYDELPVCEKGPNGGRVMWFPPYGLTFNDQSTADWNPTSFIGRPEPIYTYKNSTRTGSISWKIIVDSPSVMNVIIEEQLKGVNSQKINSIMDSFFAGCAKFDLYTLAQKFNRIPADVLKQYQEILNNPRLTPEQLEGVNREIPKENTNSSSNNIQNGPSTQSQKDDSVAEFKTKYDEFAFYFDNDQPDPKTRLRTTSKTYQETYSIYTSQSNIGTYVNNANGQFNSNDFNINVKTFFDDVVIGNFDKMIKGDSNFIVDAYNILSNKLGTITITLEGSASAPNTPDYNKDLSERRIDSVRNFFKTYKVGDKGLNNFINDGTFIIKSAGGQGEEISVTPKKTDGSTFQEINCSQDIKNKNNTVTSQSQWYSVSAMGCRRVKMTISTTETEPQPTITTNTIPPPQPKETINTPKPQPTENLIEKSKRGISKKILRYLLSECDYFEVIKNTNPMYYDTIKEKVKFFSPAFHSMTPEGLNARLTFLNQCVRPGETIPVIGTDGKPKFNDAMNTSFGAPPVLVLRIGDFYHTKIIPKNVSFTYDPLIYDMNPEGIGVQPMIANVTLSFDFIGGHGLAKPIETLQNALSFNYYGNTEIYDERAEWTEDTSALDKQVYNAILDGQVNATVNNVENNKTNNGGTTIGDIITNIPVDGGQTGEMSYEKIMDSLLDITQNYITNTTNQIEIFNNNKDNGNYGLVQLINNDRTLTTWTAGGNGDFIIYGKPSDYQTKINKAFNSVYDDIRNNTNPLIRELITDGFDEIVYQRVGENIITYLRTLSTTFANNITTGIQELVNNQQEFINTINKLNLVSNTNTDGVILEGNVPRPYSLSGINDSDSVLSSDFNSLNTVIDSYNGLLTANGIVSKTYNDGNFDLDTKLYSKNFENSTTDKLFFMVISRVFDDKNKLETFKKTIITPEIKKLKSPKNIERRFDKHCNDLASDYSKVLRYYEKDFQKFKKIPQYLDLTEGLTDDMYPKGKVRRFNYTTVPGPNNEQQKNDLLNLYVKNKVNFN